MFLESSGVTQILGAHIRVHRSSLTALLLWLPMSSLPSHSPVGVSQPSSCCGHLKYQSSTPFSAGYPSEYGCLSFSLDLAVLGDPSLLILRCLWWSLSDPGTTTLHLFHVRCTCLHLPPHCHLLHCLKGISTPSASASVDLLLSTNVCVARNHSSCCRLSLRTQTHF